MNKYSAFLICIIIIVNYCNSKEIFVAKSGNDSNDGTQNSPYLTISKAASVAIAGDIVKIGEGAYEETLKPTNSGIVNKPIVFESQPGQKVIITAMQNVNDWTHYVGAIYKTVLTWDLGQSFMVMNNGKVMDLARWPNNTDGEPYTLNSVRSEGGSGSSVLANAYLLNSQIPNIDWTNANIMFFGDRSGSGWTTWREFIKSSSAGRVNFDVNKSASWIITAHPPGDGGDFFLEGAKAALDYGNEWWFDAGSKTLYVQVPEGTIPLDGQISVRKRKLTVDLSTVSYIEVRNLAVYGGAVEIGGNNNRLSRLTSFHGDYNRGIAQTFIADCRSIYVKWNAANNTIENCEIAYGGGSGIFDTGLGTKILNNYIHHFNYIGDYNAPILSRAPDPGGCHIKNNTIKYGGRDAIQIITKNSIVEYNDISFSNMIVDDCGLLYTIGENLYMSIHHNWFHDAFSRGALKKAAGIYLDNNSGEVNVYRNVVWNTEWTSLQMNWNCKNINVFNNTLVKNSSTMGAWHNTGTFFTNVKVWNNLTDKKVGTGSAGQETEYNWEPQADKQNNLIDMTSFVNWEKNDFNLLNNSLAIDYGKIIPGYTDGYIGANPDVGAFEYGDNWNPGVTWDLQNGPANICYGFIEENCSQMPADNSPFNETPFAIPGTIEAEQYDKGGEAISFHDAEVANLGGQYRTDGVDIGALNPGNFLGWTSAGEWLEYTIEVSNNDLYGFQFFTSSLNGGGTVSITIDGDILLSNVNIPKTGDWNTYTSFSQSANLSSGKHVLRFNIITAGFNLDKIVVSKAHITQTIALTKGWNLISTNLHPVDSSIATLFNGLDVDMVKNMNTYWKSGLPPFLNSLTHIEAGKGYLINMNTAGTLTITGTPLSFSNFQINSIPNWILMGCPFQSLTPFADYFNATNCEIIKNFDGFWVPNGSKNSIQNLESGKAYFVRSQ